MSKTFYWQGQLWQCAMEGGRIIHPQEPWMWMDREQVWIGESGEGSAILTMENKPKEVHFWDGQTYHPTIACGLMRTVDAFSYGRFSAEILLPQGRNLWPSFWLCGDGSWPDHGEIDVVEAYANKRGSYYRFPLSWNVTNNVHYSDNGTHKQAKARGISMFCIGNPKKNCELVKYEVVWTDKEITLYANGKRVRAINKDIVKHLVGTRQRVIFNAFASNGKAYMESPMIIDNFKYEPL